jgi:hypothetical protein
MKSLLISLILAIAIYFAPIALAEPAARALVPAIALMATGIFPCMSLVVGAMKGEQRTPALVEQLYRNLEILLKLLVTAFALSVGAVLLLAITVSLAADAAAQLPSRPIFQSWVAHAIAASAIMVLTILGGRVFQVGRAFFTVLEINRKHALLVSRAKVRGERDLALESSRDEKFPEDDQSPRQLIRA